MRTQHLTRWSLEALLVAALGCSPRDEGSLRSGGPQAGSTDGGAPNAGGGGSTPSNVDSLDEVDDLPGTAVVIEPRDGEAFVDLSAFEQVDVDDAPSSLDWDLAFDGWRISTNSGPNGIGSGAAFGPGDELDFLFDEAPEVPFLRADTAGGAFAGWYAYDGSTHSIWSRYHVYGIRSGDDLYKLQILGYYGELAGAPVTALYSVRLASVTESGMGEIVELTNLDATAGWPNVSDDAPSACVDLSSGTVLALTPAEARDSSEWHVCFRRDVVLTNGGAGGPGDVETADLMAERTASETLSSTMQRTAEGELSTFEDVEYDDLTASGVEYVADGPVSIFSDLWYEREGDDFFPRPASWFVRGADGREHYLVVFREITGTPSGPTRVTLQVREVAR